MILKQEEVNCDKYPISFGIFRKENIIMSINRNNIEYKRQETPEDLKMKKLGLKFIINSSMDRKSLFEQSAKINNIKCYVSDNSYDVFGVVYKDRIALYVDENINDLTKFWDTIRDIENN